MKEIMSWLFKNPINSGLAQFDHTQTVKNSQKAKKIKLPQMNFFVKKQLRVQNGPFVMNQKFFGTNHYYYFHLPTGTFHLTKFKKILTVDQ